MNGQPLSVDQVIAMTPDLPSMPAAALAVMRETELPTCSARSVSDLICQDQALAARVLRLANSAYYGLQRRVGDIQEAVVVLGMRSVRNLSIVASTYTWMSRPLSGYQMGPKDMWSHSFGVGVCAQELGKRTRKADPDVAFAAGLLHNIGKVVLSAWLEDRLEVLIRASERENVPFDELERTALGFDHTDVGGRLAEQWNMPESIVDAIKNHHQPERSSKHPTVVDCVHLGDCLTSSLGIGIGADAMLYSPSAASLDRLGLTESELEPVLSECVDKCSQYEKVLLDVEGPGAKAA
jgi:putative nucleotidyltransferase with HDIG domain